MIATSKRGRRKVERPEIDKGTPELQLKRQAEVIDYLAEKSLISSEQQFVAGKFRWLYTLRYGLPHATAMNLTENYGRSVKQLDPEWLEAREQEFGNAGLELRKINAHKAVMNAVLFNIFRQSELPTLREGLSLLVKIWH